MARSAFGNVTVLPSESVRARYSGPDMATHTRTFKPSSADSKRQRVADAKRAARRWLDDEARLIEADQWSPPKHRRAVAVTTTIPTVAEYGELWIDGRVAGTIGAREMKPTTARVYRLQLSKHITPVLGDIPLDQLTPGHVADWYGSLLRDRPKMRADTYSLLRTVMGAAVKDHDLPSVTVNPCQIDGAGKMHESKQAHEPVTLEPARVVALADEMGRRALIYVLSFACLRFGEAVALQRRDIDLKNGTITVRGGVVRVEDGTYERTTTKSGKKRVVPMLPEVAKVLERHLREEAQPGRDGLVFPSGSGGFLRREAVWGEAPTITEDGEVIGGSGFRRARAVIGEPTMHLHDLRHSGATLFAQHRATVRELMTLLGHSTPDMAMRYQHVAEGRMASLAAAVDAAIFPTSEA